MSKKESSIMKANKWLDKAIFFVIALIIILLLWHFLFSKPKVEVSFSCIENNTKLKIGEKKTINYEINDSNYDVEWFSSNPSIVSVSGDLIEAKDYGTVVLTGLVNDNNSPITTSCTVTTYSGELGVNLSKIDVPSGYLLMKENSDYTIPFTVNPNNTYIEKIEYYSNDSNVAYISDNKIISNNVGEAIITMVINNNVSRNIIVKVSKNAPSNRFVEDVVSVTFDNKAITMEKGTAKELKYQINPSNGYVDTIDWESSNNEVITVKDGLINAIKEGEAIVTVRVNNTIESKINIKVKDPIITPTPTENETIVIEKKPKESIEIGEYTDIIAHVKPTTSSKAIKFMSSRPNVATVDQNGIIKGISPGTTTITLFIGNSNAKFYTIKVTSTASNVKYTWGYESSKAKTPVYANKGFFQNLASKGRGTFNGDVYYISSSLGQFSYNLNTSVLTVNGGKSIKVRIFYPESTDLSLANTLVYLGGDGEKDFGGYFSTIASNPSIMRSSGILILVAQGNGVSFDADSAICATKFVQVITNQKSGVKNSILGFSTGGKYVLEASHRFNYYKTVIFSSWSADPASTVNVKNKEVLYFIPYGDSLYRLAKDTLVELRNYGYKYVTLVTNSSELLSMFNGSGFRLINPGSGMISGHVSSNVASSGIVAYVND